MVVFDRKGYHTGQTVKVKITSSTSATLFGEAL
jgi:tRNA-2-methylthio-N6-dimethylallyladenosine synthase